MTQFSVRPHQHVDPQLRDRDPTSIQLRMIPHNEKAGCNLEWFLTQQQNTRQPSRNGGGRLFQSQKNSAHQSRNLLMSSQTTKRSLLQSRQRTAGQMLRSNENLKSNPSEFGFLTTQTQLPRKTTRASSLKRLKNKKWTDQDEVELSQSQMVRKIHADLQEYAIQQLEEREQEKIGTKMKFAISQLKQSAQLQGLAIKFWILIVNLQYYDVKKLSQNFNERQIEKMNGGVQAFTEDCDNVQVQHTQLPVDLRIYERVIVLFMKALGSVGDPHFNPVAIPSSIEKLNAIIKRNQKSLLLNGQVHYDKFVVDLGLMLGRNLLNLANADVAFIYRKCMLVMTHRFNDDFHFIQASGIKSPFEMSAILQAQRNIVGANRSPVIIESSIQSNREDNNLKRSRQASRVQIIQSNEDKNSSKSKHSPRLSSKLGLRKDKNGSIPLSAQNLQATDYIVRRPSQRKQTEKHMHSYNNFSKTQQMENPEGLPPPPHLDPEQLSELPNQLLSTGTQRQIQRLRTGKAEGRHRSDIQFDMDSKSSQRSKRQEIKVGIPMEKALCGDNDEDFFCLKKKSSRNTDMKISSSEEGQSSRPKINAQITHQPFEIPLAKEKQPLFDFDNLTAQRQYFKDELAAKIAYTKAKTATMVPFEAVQTKKSCLDVLQQAKEYLIDECLRVSKTPAGFNRPHRAESKKRLVFKNGGMIENEDETVQASPQFMMRQGTKRLDSGNCDVNMTSLQQRQDHRDTANMTAFLGSSDPKSDQVASSKLPQPMPLAKRHLNHMGTCESLQSEEASIASNKAPLIHVTKFGMRIPASMAMDPGYVMHRLEQTAKEVCQTASQEGEEGEISSGRQEAFQKQARESIILQSMPMTLIHSTLAKQAKMDLKTHRLLQETTLDNIFRNHNISKSLKKPQAVKDEEEKQFIAVIGKLNQDSLVRPPPKQRSHVVKDISFQEVQQRSFEEGDQTHATTSNDDSQFMTQDPVTHPKFTSSQDAPMDYPDGVYVQGFGDNGNLDSGRRLQQTPPKGNKKGLSNGKVTTLLKPAQGKLDSPNGKQSLAVRRRVFGFQHMKNLTSVSPTQSPTKEHQRSPIIVNRVEKNDIDEMEGKQVTQPSKVNQKVGSDGNTNRSQLHALNVDGLKKPYMMVSDNTLLDLGHASGFDRDRKSQVTAHLASGNESWKAFSSPENQLSESATQSIFKRQNSDYVEKLSQREVVSSNYRSANKSAKNPHFVRTAPMSDLACSDLDQVMSFQDRYGSSKNMVQAKKNSNSTFSRLSKNDATGLGERVININVNQSREEDARRASSHQISLISVNQVRKARQSSMGQISSHLSYHEKVKVMERKQDQVFPFGEKAPKQNLSKPSQWRAGSTGIGKSREKQTQNIQDGLFALRRANKNRRQQLKKATHQKKERICNSLIPGVDYSRQVRQLSVTTSMQWLQFGLSVSPSVGRQYLRGKAAYGRIYDSQGNLLTAITDPLKTQMVNSGGTLLIPEELMQKMKHEGFMVFSQDIKDKAKIKTSFMGTSSTLQNELSVMKSPDSAERKEYSDLISNHTPSSMREVVVKNNRALQAESAMYHMVVRSERSQNRTPLAKTQDDEASTQMLLGDNSSPLQHRLTGFGDHQAPTPNFTKLDLEKVVSGDGGGKTEKIATEDRVLFGKAKSLAFVQAPRSPKHGMIAEQTEGGEKDYHTIHQMGPPGDAKNQPRFNQERR